MPSERPGHPVDRLRCGDLLAGLRQRRLMAIVRGSDPGAAYAAGATLVDAGFLLLEVSLTTPGALSVLERLATTHGDIADLGAGTVLTQRQARDALSAGATFLVTPALGPGVTEALALGAPVLAGALTPTEVLTGWQLGATAIKLFPAHLAGPGYLQALRGPFPDIPIVPVGGVDAVAAAEFLRAGALAVGVGSPLLGDAADGGDLAALRLRAAHYLAVVQGVVEGPVSGSVHGSVHQ